MAGYVRRNGADYGFDFGEFGHGLRNIHKDAAVLHSYGIALELNVGVEIVRTR